MSAAASTATFVAASALLAFAASAALAWPLRRSSPRLFVALVAGVPLLALCLYRLVGTPTALDSATAAGPRTLDAAIDALESDLARDPRQPEGWRLLARARAGQGDAAAARDAFARAAALLPDDLPLQVEYAEARARASDGHRFDADAVALLERVLAADPAQQRARWFLGVARRQAGDAAGAAATWEPLLAQIDTAAAAALRPQVDAARADAGLPPLPATTATPDPSTAPDLPATAATAPAAAEAAGAHAITIDVAIDPAIAARAAPGAVVFVIARAPGGPPMPVAVERLAPGALPARVVLGDDDGPMPTRRLSDLDAVELIARLSLDGSATRGAGDLESAPVRIALPAAAPVTLTIAAPRR